MDCQRAQAQLELERLGQEATSRSEVLDAERHVAACDHCRAVVAAERQYDSQVGRAMRDVPMPAGLVSRLHAAVGPVTVSEPAQPLPRRRVLRRLGWASLALVPMLVAGALLIPRPVVLSEANIRELGRLDVGLLPVSSSATVSVPAGWNAQRAVVLAGDARVATVKGTEVPLLTFATRPDRRSAVSTGFLIRMPAAQWQVAPDSESFSDAIIQYAPFGTWVAWREGSDVVVCVLQGDAHAMQQLQKLIAAGRQLT